MNKLTSLQLFTIMICTTCFSFMTHFPFTHDNAQVVMISVLISTAIQFILAIPVILLKSRCAENNVCTLVMGRKPVLGRIIMCIYILFFLVAVFLITGNFTYFLDYYFADYIPRIMIVIICISAAIYLAGMKTKVIGKTSLSAIILFVIFTSAVIIGSLKKFSFVNFNLADEHFGLSLWNGIKTDFVLNWDMLLFVFLMPDLKGKGKSAFKTAGFYFLAKLVIIETILAFITMILGDYGVVSRLSFFSMASYSSSSFIQCFDAAFMFLWVVLALVKLSAYIHCAGRGLMSVVPEIPFKISVSLCGIVPSALALTLLIPHKWKGISYFTGGLWVMFVQIILICLIPLAVLIFMKKGKQNETS